VCSTCCPAGISPRNSFQDTLCARVSPNAFNAPYPLRAIDAIQNQQPVLGSGMNFSWNRSKAVGNFLRLEPQEREQVFPFPILTSAFTTVKCAPQVSHVRAIWIPLVMVAILALTGCVSTIPPCAGVNLIEFEKTDVALVSRVLTESIVSHNQWYRESCS